MTRDEYLRKLATEIYDLKGESKKDEDRLKELRSELFELVSLDYRGKDHLLPVRTVEVPDEFFQRTGMSITEYAESRYPGWVIEHVEKNTALYNTTIIFKKDPDYVTRIVEVDNGNERFTVAREISESTPEIDWDTLKVDRPDLYEQLVEYETIEVLNSDALEDLMESNPEELAVLQRHMKLKPPVQKLTARKAKKDD